ncbi:MAG: hypothetical protein ACTS6P_01165 [Candidatus Hodgkinia cicadicola]
MLAQSINRKCYAERHNERSVPNEGRSEVKRGLVVKVSLKVRLERIKRDIEVQYALKRGNRG